MIQVKNEKDLNYMLGQWCEESKFVQISGLSSTSEAKLLLGTYGSDLSCYRPPDQYIQEWGPDNVILISHTQKYSSIQQVAYVFQDYNVISDSIVFGFKIKKYPSSCYVVYTGNVLIAFQRKKERDQVLKDHDKFYVLGTNAFVGF